MLTQFDIGSASRVGRVVRLVEQQTPPAKPLTFDVILDNRVRMPAAFRICTFSGSWNKGDSKVVTHKYNTTAPNTAYALNLFASIPAPSGTAHCAISREGTAWFLIAAEC